MKRAYKLQEFVAHTSHVNCLKIGRKSAGVLVTGGEDKKVNVWAIGKPTPVLSLSGHQSAVECVSFDSAEEVVVAGATGGTVKLWDLEQAKVTRTLTGHRSSCLSVDFHPFGDYFASGSLDTSVKVWDVRRKACISTYKGHSRGATHVQFSPDGRLLTSGGQDGDLKVWELTAGKLLHEFRHDDAITAIQYHPSEFILATSSADRTVKWWDLETSELIDAAGPDMTGGSLSMPAVPLFCFPFSLAVGLLMEAESDFWVPANSDKSTWVRSIAFPANGDCLLAAVQDGLNVWAWEPVRRLDTVDAPWAKVRDMSLNEQDGKLVACSCNNSFVGVWVVELNKIKPFSCPAVRPTTPQTGPVDLHSGHNSSMFASPQPQIPLGTPASPSLVGRSPLLQQHPPSPLIGSALDQGPSALSPALIRATKAPPGSRRSPLPYITDSTSLPLNARLGLHTGDGLMTQGPSNSVLVPEADEGVIGCWPVQSAEGTASSSQPASALPPNASTPLHGRTNPNHSHTAPPPHATDPHQAFPSQQLFSTPDTHAPPPQEEHAGGNVGSHSKGPSTPPHPVAMLAQEALQSNSSRPLKQCKEEATASREGVPSLVDGGCHASQLGAVGQSAGGIWKDKDTPTGMGGSRLGCGADPPFEEAKFFPIPLHENLLAVRRPHQTQHTEMQT
ncbi:Quinone-dependent D-lactate dehydrogenase [Trebouxia sp. C0009 RCD-2024]